MFSSFLDHILELSKSDYPKSEIGANDFYSLTKLASDFYSLTKLYKLVAMA
jgi:hypothetical protein